MDTQQDREQDTQFNNGGEKDERERERELRVTCMYTRVPLLNDREGILNFEKVTQTLKLF